MLARRICAAQYTLVWIPKMQQHQCTIILAWPWATRLLHFLYLSANSAGASRHWPHWAPRLWSIVRVDVCAYSGSFRVAMNKHSIHLGYHLESHCTRNNIIAWRSQTSESSLLVFGNRLISPATHNHSSIAHIQIAAIFIPHPSK